MSAASKSARRQFSRKEEQPQEAGDCIRTR
jgi:hypothetical protein